LDDGKRVKAVYTVPTFQNPLGWVESMARREAVSEGEGGGWVRMYETKGEALVPHTDWFQGYRDIVMDEVRKAALQK
jgi:hypothetical protein